MTWADIVKMGLDEAEKKADRDNVIDTIIHVIEDTVAAELEKIKQENSHEIEELKRQLSRKINQEIETQPTTGLSPVATARLRAIEGNLNDLMQVVALTAGYLIQNHPDFNRWLSLFNIIKNYHNP